MRSIVGIALLAACAQPDPAACRACIDDQLSLSRALVAQGLKERVPSVAELHAACGVGTIDVGRRCEGVPLASVQRPGDRVPAPPVEAPSAGSGCAEAERDVAAALTAAAACETDADCVPRHVATCAIATLDCYSAHVNRAADMGPVEHALAAHGAACRSARHCRCAEPERSACRDGTCGR